MSQGLEEWKTQCGGFFQKYRYLQNETVFGLNDMEVYIDTAPQMPGYTGTSYTCMFGVGPH